MGMNLGGALLLLSGVLLTACFSPAAPVCALQCSDDAPCPSGLACSAGLCAAPGETCGAAGGADGSLDSGAGGCGQLAGLADDFEDDLIDAERWYSHSNGGAALREDGGLLVFELAAEVAEPQVARVISTEAFPVARFDARARIHYANEAASLSLQLHAESSDCRVALVASPGMLKMVGEGETHTESSTTQWEAATHPWWRLRQDQDEIVFAVSSDGDAWERIGAVDATRLGERATVELSGFTGSAADAPRLIGFDEIGPVCP